MGNGVHINVSGSSLCLYRLTLWFAVDGSKIFIVFIIYEFDALVLARYVMYSSLRNRETDFECIICRFPKKKKKTSEKFLFILFAEFHQLDNSGDAK